MLLCSLQPVDNHVSEQSLQPKEDKYICIYKYYTQSEEEEEAEDRERGEEGEQ